MLTNSPKNLIHSSRELYHCLREHKIAQRITTAKESNKPPEEVIPQTTRVPTPDTEEESLNVESFDMMITHYMKTPLSVIIIIVSAVVLTVTAVAGVLVNYSHRRRLLISLKERIKQGNADQ